MPRIVLLLIVVVALIGGLFILSTLPRQKPTHQIELDVAQGAAAGGQKH